MKKKKKKNGNKLKPEQRIAKGISSCNPPYSIPTEFALHAKFDVNHRNVSPTIINDCYQYGYTMCFKWKI